MEVLNLYNEDFHFSHKVKKRRIEYNDDLKTPQTKNKDCVSLSIYPLDIISEQTVEVLTPRNGLSSGLRKSLRIIVPLWAKTLGIDKEKPQDIKATQSALSADWGYFVDPENGKKIKDWLLE